MQQCALLQCRISSTASDTEETLVAKGRGRGEDEGEDRDEGGGQLEGGKWLLVSTQVHNVLLNGFSLFLIFSCKRDNSCTSDVQ